MHRKSARRLALSAGLVSAAVIFAGCSAATPTVTDTVVFAYNFVPRANFAPETDDAGILTRSGAAETLTKASPDGSLEPLLAASWEQVDPLTWEFTLRDDVTFHDGTPLNADAVVGSITYLLESKAPPRSFTPDLFTAVEAVSEHVVRFSTPSPNAILPYQFAGPNTVILAPAAYDGASVDPVGTGTGPYTITDLSKEFVDLEANEAYWDGAPKIEKARMRFILDGAVRATMVETGEAHIVSAVPVSAVTGLEGKAEVEVLPLAAPRTYSLYLNNGRAPLDDVRVRQAIQAGIDVEEITAQVLEGFADPGVGPFGLSEAWAPDGAAPVQRDIDAATALLSDAGYAPGDLSLSLWTYNGLPELNTLATVVQAQLSEIGIDSEIRVAEYGTLEPEVLAGDYDMFIVLRGHLQEALDPLGFLTSDYTCEGGFNVSHFCDPAVDRMLNDARALSDDDARYTTYQGIAEQLQRDAVTVFLAHGQDITATSANLDGFVGDPFDTYVLTNDLTFK